MSVIVAARNCLTFTNRFWESKLPSVLFNMESPAMQIVPSGYLFGMSLDGRLSSCVTAVTKIDDYLSDISEIASLSRLLSRHLE